MSQGAFRSSKYESDSGAILNVRVQPETELANIGGVNSPPAGDVDTIGSATVAKGIRENGVGTRMVSLRWTGAAPTDYVPTGTVRIPILTPAVFNGINIGDTGTYLGADCVVIGKSPERVR